METQPRNIYLHAASILSWIMGIIAIMCTAGTTILGIPILSKMVNITRDVSDASSTAFSGAKLIFILILGICFLIGIGYCFVGYGLLKEKKIAGIIGLILTGGSLVLAFTAPSEQSLVNILVGVLVSIINLIIFSLILVTFKKLKS